VQLDQLNELYRLVEVANYLASQTPVFLQIAALASDEEVQRRFTEQAARISTQPFGDIVQRSESMTKLLARLNC
jgi:hypothetical protein